jgi:hypothetical protein
LYWRFIQKKRQPAPEKPANGQHIFGKYLSGLPGIFPFNGLQQGQMFIRFKAPVVVPRIPAPEKLGYDPPKPVKYRLQRPGQQTVPPLRVQGHMKMNIAVPPDIQRNLPAPHEGNVFFHFPVQFLKAFRPDSADDCVQNG